jgi:hypothetical protein
VNCIQKYITAFCTWQAASPRQHWGFAHDQTPTTRPPRMSLCDWGSGSRRLVFHEQSAGGGLRQVGVSSGLWSMLSGQLVQSREKDLKGTSGTEGVSGRSGSGGFGGPGRLRLSRWVRVARLAGEGEFSA